jgi:hypothetical protein
MTNVALPPVVFSKTIPEGNLQRIRILLKEYDTLRAEILQRTAAGFALAPILAAIVGWLGSRILEGHRYTAIAAGLMSVCTLFLGPKFMNIRIRRCSARLQRIEQRINSLAEDDLLEWESRWGIGGAAHHFRDAFRNPPPRPVTPDTL